MSQLKVNTIRHTGASSDAVTLASDGTATAKLTNNLSNRNLIINGAMQVAQRGSSVTDDGYQTVDRFSLGYGGTDNHLTQAQHALTSSDTGPWEKGFRYSYHITNGNQTSGAGAGDFAQILYKPEGQDINSSGWNFTDPNSKVTISYWVKSSVAQNYYGFIEGGSPTRIFGWETGALTANTWKKVTVTIPGYASLAVPNTTASAFTIAFIPFYGTNYTHASNRTVGSWYEAYNYIPDMTSTWWTTDDATFEVTGLQLEVSDYATDFEHRSYADELHRCRRYYLQFGASGMDGDFVISASQLASNGDQTRPGIIMNPQLRAVPTMTEFGDGLNIYGSGSVTPVTAISDITYNAQSSLLGFNCECADIGDNYEIVTVTNRPNGGVQISAEL